VAKGIGQISLQTETPVTFGVLTTDTLEQALERAAPRRGTKVGPALSAIELADLKAQLSEGKKGSKH